MLDKFGVPLDKLEVILRKLGVTLLMSESADRLDRLGVKFDRKEVAPGSPEENKSVTLRGPEV